VMEFIPNQSDLKQRHRVRLGYSIKFEAAEGTFAAALLFGLRWCPAAFPQRRVDGGLIQMSPAVFYRIRPCSGFQFVRRQLLKIWLGFDVCHSETFPFAKARAGTTAIIKRKYSN